MSVFNRLGSWINQAAANKRTPYRRRDRLHRLLVEVLEERLAPAIPATTHTFDLNGSFADAVNPAVTMTGPGGTLGATGYTFGMQQGPSADVIVNPQKTMPWKCSSRSTVRLFGPHRRQGD